MRPASLMMAVAIALIQGSPPAPPPPRPAEAIALSYTLRIFAIPFGHLDYAASFGRVRYTAEMHFRTSGLAAALWKANIDASAEGQSLPDGSLVPGVYTTRSLSRRGTRQSVRVVYGGKAGPVMTAEPPYDLSRYPVSEAQKKGAVDPLTAISSLVGGRDAPHGEACGRTLAVYDGRRRYDVGFSPVRTDAGAPDSAANPRICKAEYRQIAGIRQEVVDVSSVPTIYARFIDVPAGERHFTIAQSIWSSFLWGAVSAHLTDARLDGRPLALAP